MVSWAVAVGMKGIDYELINMVSWAVALGMTMQ